MGKMFFNILAAFAEFEVDLLRMRTREGMAVARAKGKLHGLPQRARLHLVTRSLPASLRASREAFDG
jgi:DNA invertase Pin-like site-specific DNA recombinase